MGVHSSEWKQEAPLNKDEDIVCSNMKILAGLIIRDKINDLI